MRQVVCFPLSLSCKCVAQPAYPQEFDLIAIKRTPESELAVEWSPAAGGRFSAKGVVLREMIAVAYGIQPFQVVGGPRWISTDHMYW
jgi:uncharacterized protein (TIGR03435 family)